MEKERDEKVLVWFKQLTVEEAAQTVTEHNEQDTKLLRQMVEKTKAAGEGLFCTPDELPSSASSGFLFKKFSFFESNAGTTFFHTERARESERKLVSSVRLCDTRVSLDTITVCTDVLVDRDAFLSLLSVVSQGGFLTVPCLASWSVEGKEWKWDYPSWFYKKGYFTIAEFLAQWIEKLIWRRYFESNRIDPRKATERSGKPYKAPTNTQLSTQQVLDPRKGRLKLFWNGLTEEEREKLSDVKVGQVMAKVVASEEKVDYLKMLKTLQKLTQDKADKSHCFDDNLRKDPVKYIEYFYLSTLELAGKVREKVHRHIGDTLQIACAEKVTMDLINSEEQAKNKPPHHSDSSVRFGKKKKIGKRKKPITSPSMPSPIKEKGRAVDLFVLNSDSDTGGDAGGVGGGDNSTNNNKNKSDTSSNSGGQSGNSNSASNSNKSNGQISQLNITRGKGKKKNKKKKKQGGRDNGTVSANDAQQRSIASSSPSSTRTRRHRHSLPEDFAQTHEALLAQIRAGAEPTDYEDEEEWVGVEETVSDGELHERDADNNNTALSVAREIVAISSDEEDLDDDDAPITTTTTTTTTTTARGEGETVRTPRRESKSPHDAPPAPVPTYAQQPTTSSFKRSSSSNAISDIARQGGSGGGGGSSAGTGSGGGFTSVTTGRRQRNASLGSYPTSSPHHLPPSSSYSKSNIAKPHQQQQSSSPRGGGGGGGGGGQQPYSQQQQQQQASHHHSSSSSPHHPRSLSVSAPTIHTPASQNAQQQQQNQRTGGRAPSAKQSLAIQALSLHEANQQTVPHPRIRDIHAQTLAQAPMQPRNTAPPKAHHTASYHIMKNSSSSSSSSSTKSSPTKLPASYASAVAPSLTTLSAPTTATTSSLASTLSSTSAPTPLTVSAPTPSSASLPVLSSSTSAPSLLTSINPQTNSLKMSSQSLSIPLSTINSSSASSSSSQQSSAPSSSLPSSSPASQAASAYPISSSAPTTSPMPPSVFYKSLSSSSLSDMVMPQWAGHYFPYHHYFSDRSLQLHHEMVDFVNYINGMAHTQHVLFQGTISRVAMVVTRLWPNSRVEVFGSFASGLWMPSSDIDLVIVGVNYGARGQIGPQTTQFLLQILERELEKEPWVQSIQSIPNTRVPVMKLVSKDGNVPIDITFSETSTHHTGIASRNLVIQYVASLPALAPLALVIKTFLRERGLNNTYTGGLSSYCLVLMIISFLNHHYTSHPPLTIGAPATETNNWGVLLLGFLSFYGKDFDYQHTGISITPGRSTFLLPPAPAPHPYPSHHQVFSIHHQPPHFLPTESKDDLHIPSRTAQFSQPSYAQAHGFLSQHADPSADSSSFPDTALQFPLESSLTSLPQPSPDPPAFATAPHIFIEDPIRKGNNIGSHAFLMNRVQAALEFAKNALKNSPNAAPTLLSRILNTRPCDFVVPSSNTTTTSTTSTTTTATTPLFPSPHSTYPLTSVRSLPS